MARQPKKKSGKGRSKKPPPAAEPSLPSQRPPNQRPSLADPVAWLQGCHKQLCEKLARLGLHSIYDLLTHYPRSYYKIRSISQLKRGEVQMVRGKIVSAQSRTTRQRRMRILEVILDQDGAQIELVFFNQPWLSRQLIPGKWISVVGPVEYLSGDFSLRPSSWSPLPGPPTPSEQSEANRLLPEYPLTEKLTNEALKSLVQKALGEFGNLFPNVLPEALVSELKLMPVPEAIREVHFPSSDDHLKAARLSLKFQEFYLLGCGLALRHRQSCVSDGKLIFSIDKSLKQRCRRRFPFTFTGAQQRVTDEVCRDLSTPGRMNRLLQGDVGSGKTAVAVYAALCAIDNGFQVALMAPTEILARQHYRNIRDYLEGSKVETRLLVGATTKAERESLLEELAAGRAHIAVGTHALIEPGVRFSALGLVVIDEQHKFGVAQRGKLYNKGNHPHRLVMSATPIPRTLSLTVFGDLDISVIDEMPPGRMPVRTLWVPEAVREKTLDSIHHELRSGEQAYFIYPLVEENPDLELKSATELYESLKERFSDIGVGLVHGQMRPDEKDAAMDDFREGRIKLLVATVVVEVGVDVPAANIMLIEHAERFGLAQLHQLRGRIGRGGKPAHLYLFAEPGTPASRERLQTLCRTTDGFEIAEVDLKLRGFGDFMGTRQSGMPKLKIADPVSDLKILARARSEAFSRIDDSDPEELRQTLALTFGRSFHLLGA